MSNYALPLLQSVTPLEGRLYSFQGTSIWEFSEEQKNYFNFVNHFLFIQCMTPLSTDIFVFNYTQRYILGDLVVAAKQEVFTIFNSSWTIQITLQLPQIYTATICSDEYHFINSPSVNISMIYYNKCYQTTQLCTH